MSGISGHVFFAEIIIYAEQEDFMTTLGCNVNACSHNKDNCCCLSSIEVHGNSACKCDETCCGSFYEADSETAKNASESPKINLSISCEAELEKQKAADEVKQQIIAVARLMASKVVAESISEADSQALIEQTLNEMGDKTWLS